MTQVNINAMDAIVNELANGKTFSEALKAVYNKRNVQIPYKDEWLEVEIQELNMSNRATNTILRNRIRTLSDLVKRNETNPIKSLRGCGKDICTEVFETILNYCWNCMDEKEKVEFLMDTVERNDIFLKETV